MSAKRDVLEYINSSMKEIDFLVEQYLSVDMFEDFSTPIVKSSQLVEILLEVLLNEKGYEAVPGRGITKAGEYVASQRGYIPPLQFCIRDNESPIPDEYKKFLQIILQNRNDAAHTGRKTKADMIKFLEAYKCFVCWYFESFDIFGNEEELKLEILKRIDGIEKKMGIPIEVEYKKNAYGNFERLLKYAKVFEKLHPSSHDENREGKNSETTNICETADPNKALKDYIDKKMSQAVEKIEATVNDKYLKLDEKLDNVTQILNNLIEQITSYQDLVQNQIELAITEDEIDRIVHAYSEECVKKIIQGVDEKYSDISRNEEEKKLIASLGEELWNTKLTSASKNYLVSSKVTYNYYLNIHTLDYSGVCLLVTKALEVEMSERFYKGFIAYLKTGYSDSWRRHLEDFPTTLIKTINGNKVLKSAKDFTLGSVSYVLCANDDKNATEAQLRNNERRLIEYAKERLMQGKSDDEILTTLKGYGEKVADITEEYRNKAAHTNELGRVDAETCFKIVLDTEQLLKKMLDSFDF